MAHKIGWFFSVEGIEGTGKSTVIKTLHKNIEASGQHCVLTREPGGTVIAEEIRQILLRHHQEHMSCDTELLLMFAGRAQNIQHIIRPALRAGHCVLADRFADASFAYQGGGRGVPSQHIEELAHWVLQGLQPDHTLILDAPVNVGLARVSSRGAKDRIELEGQAFFERARETYLSRAAAAPDRYTVIDATQTPEQVQNEAWAALSKWFKGGGG